MLQKNLLTGLSKENKVCLEGARPGWSKLGYGSCPCPWQGMSCKVPSTQTSLGLCFVILNQIILSKNYSETAPPVINLQEIPSECPAKSDSTAKGHRMGIRDFPLLGDIASPRATIASCSLSSPHSAWKL